MGDSPGPTHANRAPILLLPLVRKGGLLPEDLMDTQQSSSLPSMPTPPPERQTVKMSGLLPKALGRDKDNLSLLRIIFPKMVSCYLGWPQPRQVTGDDLECPILLTTISQG